jgi:hypothetical protein
VATEFGAVVTLICGDLFNEDVLGQCRAARPDVVLAPIARGFDADVADDYQWKVIEQGAYTRQLHRTGAQPSPPVVPGQCSVRQPQLVTAV